VQGRPLRDLLAATDLNSARPPRPIPERAARIALAAAVLLAWATAHRLALNHGAPPTVVPYVAGFAVAFGLAFAGALATADDRDPSDRVGGLEPCGAARIVFLCVAVGAISATWLLQREPPPRFVLATWAVSLVATPFAFPGVAVGTRADRWPRWATILAVAAFLVAAWARLTHLDSLPPVFSGDEANQVFDGRDWLRSAAPTDPFGTGWIGTFRLGMIPAGVGGSFDVSPVAGPRFPYAVVGTLSVAAAGWAAAIVGGPLASVGCLAFLALAPHHVHFSRLASVQILDSLLAPLAIALLLLVRRTGSPRLAAFAGVVSGLSLYGYFGGRVIAVLFLVATAWVAFAGRWPSRRRGWIVLALVAGFAVSSGPNFRFAVRHFDDWNGRFNQVSIFQTGWLDMEARRHGSLARVAGTQLKDGVLGLLYADDQTPWFTGHPMVPALLAGAGLAGLGWLLGRRGGFAFALPLLVVAGNLAGSVLTTTTPAPQRLSSLFPALAIFAGVAFAGLVSLLPERGRGGTRWQAAGAALAAGALIAGGLRGYPLDWEPYAGYGGRHAALAKSAAWLLDSPRFARDPVRLHGWRYVDSSFPSFRYFLPGRRFLDDDPGMTGYTEESFPPGLHLFSSEWVSAGREWQRRLGLAHGIPLAHPAYPRQDVGYVLVVPRDGVQRTR
jgi:hypothetical protein